MGGLLERFIEVIGYGALRPSQYIPLVIDPLTLPVFLKGFKAKPGSTRAAWGYEKGFDSSTPLVVQGKKRFRAKKLKKGG